MYPRNPPHDAAPVVIHTLGRFDIYVHGERLRFARRAPRRPLELLAALLARGGCAVHSGTLCDSLWPDADPFDASRAFTITLHRLRRLLRHDGALVLSMGLLSLDPQICATDIWLLESALRLAKSHEACEAALACYAGPFLGEDDSPWALATRARLDQAMAHLMGRDAFPGRGADRRATAHARGAD